MRVCRNLIVTIEKLERVVNTPNDASPQIRSSPGCGSESSFLFQELERAWAAKFHLSDFFSPMKRNHSRNYYSALEHIPAIDSASPIQRRLKI